MDPTPLDRDDLEALLARISRESDRAAFAVLFDHFAPRVKAYLLRLGLEEGRAEEVVQEVMLKVWNKAASYDPGQAAPSTWIFTIARNRRIDIARRESQPAITPGDPALVPEAEEAADRRVQRREEAAHIARAIAALPAEQAELLRLAYFEDLAHGAIAERTGLPLGTVKSRLRLAMDKLRRRLGEELQ